MIFNELSNAAFRFALRAQEPRYTGLQTPPSGGGKSRGPAGRGFINFFSWSSACSHVISNMHICIDDQQEFKGNSSPSAWGFEV